MHFLKALYMNTKLFTNKIKTEHKNKLRSKINEIRANPKFNEELIKVKTGIKFNDDIIFTTKYLSEDFKNKNENIKSTFEKLKRHERIEINLNGLNISDNIKYSCNDILLYNTSILKYNISMGYFNKALINISNSIEILDENKISKFDPMMISFRLDRAYIESYQSDNFKNIINNILEEMANGYIIEDPAIIITGYLYLIKLFYYFNLFSKIPMLTDMTYETMKKYNLSNQFVKDAMLKTFLMNLYKKRSQNKFIQMHSNPTKMHVLSELRKNIEVYNIDPLKYYILLEKIDQTIKYFNETNPNDPLLWQLYIKKWVIANRIGREATAPFYMEYSKLLVVQNYYLNESNVVADFNREALLESITYQDYELAHEYFKKNIKVTNKLNFMNLNFKSVSAQFAAFNKAYPVELNDKLEDFVKSHDKFFDNEEDEFKNLVFDNLKGMGYRSLIDNFEKVDDKKKKKEIMNK